MQLAQLPLFLGTPEFNLEFSLVQILNRVKVWARVKVKVMVYLFFFFPKRCFWRKYPFNDKQGMEYLTFSSRSQWFLNILDSNQLQKAF